jgi:nitrate/TMAO reductase-like tetraheme cytochrome c subunit
MFLRLPLQRLVLLVFFLSYLGAGRAAARSGIQKGLRYLSSRSCGKCHREIYQQWKRSLHAQSTALEDPIHGTFYRTVVGEPTQAGLLQMGRYPVCLQCHAPAAAKDGVTNLAARDVYKEGVNCVSCHSFTSYKGIHKETGGLRHGVEAYEFSDTTLQGASGKNHGQAHPFNASGHPVPVAGNPGLLRSNQVCMGCHDMRRNPYNVALCQTGDEISSSSGATNCLGCHMPVVRGKADHSMLGGHSPDMVAKGLRLTLEARATEKNTQVHLTLTNLLPHKFPTGAPFRNVFILLTALNSRGEVVWNSSPKGHPFLEDRQAVLMYKLGDAAGHPAPPPKATQVLGDSRLKPGEVRTLHYQIPTSKVTHLRAEAFYDLLLPPMKEKFAAKLPEELLKPRLIATALVNLTSR